MEDGPRSQAGAVPGHLRAGDLLIDFAGFVVSRNGQVVPLPRLSFDLLAALVRASPGVLTHDELMARVWPGMVISQETLTQRVKLLRAALGDDPAQPRYIAGLRGRGYRLVPAVVPSAPVDHRSLARRRVSRTAVLATAMLAALIVGFHLWSGTSTSPPLTIDGQRTVAVLPFDAIGGSASDIHLGLGIAEQVIERLATVDSLTVLARGSAFFRVDRGSGPRELGARLGATLLVRGSVQRQGNSLRVTASVVDTQSGHQVGALRVDGTLSTLFALQDEVSASIARILSIAPGPAPAGTTNIEAWLDYLSGLEAESSWRIADTRSALQYFRRARERDPAFAAAYAAEANAYSQLALLQAAAPAAYREQALALIERALAMNPGLGTAYAAWAWFATDQQAAVADARLAVKLSPASSEAHIALAAALRLVPEHRTAALVSLEHAVRIDPLQPHPRYELAMDRFYAERDLPALADRLLEVLRIDPGFTRAYTRLAMIRGWHQGRLAEGIALIERGIAADSESTFARNRASELYVAIGDASSARRVLSHLPDDDPDMLAISYLLDDDAHPPSLPALLPPRRSFGGRAREIADITYALALRDSALQSGGSSGALRAGGTLQCPTRLTPQPCVQPDSPALAISLGELSLAAGDRQSAERLLAQARQSLEHDQPVFLPVYTTYNLARLHMLQGRPDEALAVLEQNHRDLGFFGLWVALQRDAAFAPLRDQARFRAIVDSSGRHAAAERGRLSEFRAAAS